MSMLRTTHFAAQPIGRMRRRSRAAPLGWRRAPLRRLLQLVRRVRRDLRSRRELLYALDLDDRALADIGLRRIDLVRASKTTFWR